VEWYNRKQRNTNFLHKFPYASVWNESKIELKITDMKRLSVVRDVVNAHKILEGKTANER
jgi:hypothetical protein